MLPMTSRRHLLLLIAVLALVSVLALAACNDTEPTPVPTQTPTPTATATAMPTQTDAPTSRLQPTPTVLGNCRDGMRLQPGEGCRYTGGGSPQANVVLSVQHDGVICREGGPAKQEIGGVTINIDNLRLCSSGGFERDDSFQSEIVANANADGSWTFYESRLSASLATAPIPVPTATSSATSTATPIPSSRGDSHCSAGMVMREGDSCTVSIPRVSVGTDRFEIREGSGCYGNICGGTGLRLNDFIATKNPDGSWTIERVPATTTESPTAVPSGAATPTAPDIARRQFEASTPPGYVEVTLSARGTVWGVPDRFTTDSSLGDVAYMLLGRLKGCSFANEELDRASIVYVKGDQLGHLSNYASAEVCGKTSRTWVTGWDGVRITHLRFFDESSPTNVREFVYDESRGAYVETPSGSS